MQDNVTSKIILIGAIKGINKPRSPRKTTLKRLWFHFLTAVAQRRQAGDYCQNKVDYLRDSNSRKMVTQNQCSHLAIFFLLAGSTSPPGKKWIERKLSRDANSSHFFSFNTCTRTKHRRQTSYCNFPYHILPHNGIRVYLKSHFNSLDIYSFLMVCTNEIES